MPWAILQFLLFVKPFPYEGQLRSAEKSPGAGSFLLFKQEVRVAFFHLCIFSAADRDKFTVFHEKSVGFQLFHAIEIDRYPSVAQDKIRVGEKQVFQCTMGAAHLQRKARLPVDENLVAEKRRIKNGVQQQAPPVGQGENFS